MLMQAKSDNKSSMKHVDISLINTIEQESCKIVSYNMRYIRSSEILHIPTYISCKNHYKVKVLLTNLSI